MSMSQSKKYQFRHTSYPAPAVHPTQLPSLHSVPELRSCTICTTTDMACHETHQEDEQNMAWERPFNMSVDSQDLFCEE